MSIRSAWLSRLCSISFLARIIPPSLARQADRLAAGLVDQVDDILVDLATEYHFSNFHGFGVGDTHALNELAFLANAGQQVLDLRSTAMNYHYVHADQFEQDDIAREALFEFFHR